MTNHATEAWEPTTSVIHLLRRAFQHVTGCWTDTVGTTLTTAQFAILNVLVTDDEEYDQAMLGERLGLDSSSGSYLIKRLERDGLVHVAVDQANRRRKLITTTDDGRRVVSAVYPRARATEEAILAQLGPADRDRLMSLLRQLIGIEPGDEGIPPRTREVSVPRQPDRNPVHDGHT